MAANTRASESRKVLLRTLQELTEDQLRSFRFHAEPRLPRGLLHDASSREHLANLLADMFPETSIVTAIEILREIPRNDLASQLQRRFPNAQPSLKNN